VAASLALCSPRFPIAEHAGAHAESDEPKAGETSEPQSPDMHEASPEARGSRRSKVRIAAARLSVVTAAAAQDFYRLILPRAKTSFRTSLLSSWRG
jgi:hypothetical protein